MINLTDIDTMKKNLVDYTDIFALMKEALLRNIGNRELFMKGVDYPYYYEE